MSYLSQQQVIDELTLARVTEALDDDGDGTIDTDLLDRLIQAAQMAVNGFLEGRYLIPLSPVPSLAQEATLIFVCEKLYARRRQGPDEKNPYGPRADEFRKELKAVSDGEKSIAATLKPAFVPGAIVSKPSRINTSTT